MADRGTKRKCASCGASYYDLNRTPVRCPKCDAPFVPSAPVRSTPLRGRMPPPPPSDVAVEADHEPEAATEGSDDYEEAEELPSDEETFGATGEEDEDRD